MRKPPLKTLAQRVAYLHQCSGLDMAPLSRVCGLSQSHLGQFIRGQVGKRPAASTLGKLASAFGVDHEWLMSGTGTVPDASAIRAAVEAARSKQQAA
jgi:transcriptional regulator with XRE-family HTH domain